MTKYLQHFPNTLSHKELVKQATLVLHAVPMFASGKDNVYDNRALFISFTVLIAVCMCFCPMENGVILRQRGTVKHGISQ